MNKTNQFCMTCTRAYNAINGRYCILLNRYVERTPTPPCSTLKQETK